MQKVLRNSDVSGVEITSPKLGSGDQQSIVALFVNLCNPSKCEEIRSNPSKCEEIRNQVEVIAFVYFKQRVLRTIYF